MQKNFFSPKATNIIFTSSESDTPQAMNKMGGGERWWAYVSEGLSFEKHITAEHEDGSSNAICSQGNNIAQKFL